MLERHNLLDWRFIVFGVFLGAVILFLGPASQASETKDLAFHTQAEHEFFTLLMDSLPRGYNGLFAGSGECVRCHGFDTAQIANVDMFGNDINLVDDWRATMMANSAKDPFWRAKVSHEVLLYPQHQAVIETKCTSCHAPLGHFAAFHHGASSYSIAEMEDDSIAMDGVSCLACHQQLPEGIASRHSGNLAFETERIAYGPFVSPLSSPMLNATLYDPIYSPHVSEGGLCAGCHTLITETLDFEGNFTGQTFVEQATYHEWLNSAYPAEDISCQSCHMPELSKGEFYLAAGFETPPRSSFYLHELAGANVHMLKLLRDNAAELGVSATLQDFENVITATENMLRHRTLDITVTDLERSPDTAFIAVQLNNKAGHKFPSGYPARRAFISLLVLNEQGDTLFHSGKTDDDFEVFGQNPTYEPHYTAIRSEDEVQIYEQVLGDVNNNVTTVLTRAASTLKDNRLPPRGFIREHPVYDTTRISGNALFDTDFNHNPQGQEGSGSDVVYYHIPTQGEAGPITVTATVYYQSMPPKWMAEMFAETTPAIERFRRMFNAADRVPVLVNTASRTIAGISAVRPIAPQLNASVHVAAGGYLHIDTPENVQMAIYTMDGRLLQQSRLSSGYHAVKVQAASQIVVVHLQKGRQQYTRQLWLPGG